jgi:cytochrome c-type biogenesis protein
LFGRVYGRKSNKLLGAAHRKGGWGGAVLIGAALGPVFSSCSPTYALIVATVLPVSFAQGLSYLAAYAIGMSATLLLIAYLGQAFVSKLRWLSNPNGWFRRAVGVLFITVGVAVIFGLDRKLQAFVLERGWYDPVGNLEKRLRD